jgi:hypothetical protein
MSNLVNNSSTTLLLANGVFRGQTIKLDQQFMTCTVNIDTDVSGVLTFNHSQDGFNFSTLGDTYNVGNGSFHKEVILKGLYFFIRYTNGSVNQTLFNLFTKLSYNVRDQNASGGGSGGDVNITGCEVTLPVSGNITCDISGQRVVTDISGQRVDISGQRVITDISGQRVLVDISGQRLDISGQSVNVYNDVNVNILDVNSVVYDFTNDKNTMTENDNRFEIDRVRPDSWSFQNSKSQGGSNVFWYSNSSTSPLGVQNFNILHGDLETLYFVAGINKTSDIEAIPFMVVYSPSPSAFYTSRWVYQVNPAEKLIQGEQVLLYYGVDPVGIYTNLRHVQMLFNAVASQGSLLETEVCYIMSINTASGLTASSVYYNLYNCGFILNDVKKTHNDYSFNSGIKSIGDENLKKLEIDNGLLNVAVGNTVGASIENASFTETSFVSCLNTVIKDGDVNVKNNTYGYINNMYTTGLNVITRDTFDPTSYSYTVGDVDTSGNTIPINIQQFTKVSIFGNSTHSGPGSHDVLLQYSDDGTVFYNSPNAIATSSAGNFALDYNLFCARYMRLRFQVNLLTLNCFICLK